MRRREFISGVLSTAAWPLVARAQQPATKVHRIGWLVTGTPTSYRFSLAAFLDGLKALGYVEGQNISIEYRWVAMSPDFPNWPMNSLSRRSMSFWRGVQLV